MGRWIETIVLWLIIIALWCTVAILAFAALIYAVSDDASHMLLCAFGAFFCGSLAHNMRRDHL